MVAHREVEALDLVGLHGAAGIFVDVLMPSAASTGTNLHITGLAAVVAVDIRREGSQIERSQMSGSRAAVEW